MRYFITAICFVFLLSCGSSTNEAEVESEQGLTQTEREAIHNQAQPEEYNVVHAQGDDETKKVADHCQAIDKEKVVSRIAFGSCNNQDKEQPLWPSIVGSEPDLWVWLGDNIYMDTEDPELMKKKYAKQIANPGYQRLLKTCPVIGTWDDHDFGVNDGTKEFPAKELSKEHILDFLCIPDSDPVRKREGIYQSHTFGEGDKKVKIILLDARTFRDPVEKSSDKKSYIPNKEADILGEAQWTWFENELKDNDAAITIIANGTQILSKLHPYEKWANFPTARKRLFKTIGTYCPKGAIMLSGDRHHGEICKVKIPKIKHYLYEITSSGLTHTRKYNMEPNKYRISEKTVELNFGMIEIDWEASPVEVSLQIRGKENVIHVQDKLVVTDIFPGTEGK